jgi:hypothetical protein
VKSGFRKLAPACPRPQGVAFSPQVEIPPESLDGLVYGDGKMLPPPSFAGEIGSLYGAAPSASLHMVSPVFVTYH